MIADIALDVLPQLDPFSEVRRFDTPALGERQLVEGYAKSAKLITIFDVEACTPILVLQGRGENPNIQSRIVLPHD